MVTKKIFNFLFNISCAVAVSTVVVTVCLVIASIANAQTITVTIPERGMHDSVHEIMESSNPACYIEGTIGHVRDNVNGRNGYRQLKNVSISPEYYIWEDLCNMQFQHNHYTDFDVPKLHRWHLNTTLRVKYIFDNQTWVIHEMFPVIYTAGDS